MIHRFLVLCAYGEEKMLIKGGNVPFFRFFGLEVPCTRKFGAMQNQIRGFSRKKILYVGRLSIILRGWVLVDKSWIFVLCILLSPDALHMPWSYLITIFT